MPRPMRYSDERLLADLRRVVAQTGLQTRAAYRRRGAYDPGLFWRRWGSFEQACREAGLPVAERPRRDYQQEPYSLASALKEAQQMRAARRRRTMRPCLRCERSFASAGPANRLCRQCLLTIDRDGLMHQMAV